AGGGRAHRPAGASLPAGRLRRGARGGRGPRGPQGDHRPGRRGARLTDREGSFVLRPIGWVDSPLADRRLAPCQGDEGAPEACLVFGQEVSEGLRDLRAGDEVIVLTWLDRAHRDVLAVRPR